MLIRADKAYKVGRFVLALWLCALLPHLSHIETVSQIDADVECHLCQNLLDGSIHTEPRPLFVERIGLELIQQTRCYTAICVAFLRPFLRAPPAYNT